MQLPGSPPNFRGVVAMPGGAFRISGAWLSLPGREIGALIVGTSLDGNYAQEPSNMSNPGVVIAINGEVVARTVSGQVPDDFGPAGPNPGGTRVVNGEEYAIREILAMACLGAIRALAAALDVLRLGALLHDIDKIGLSDEVLRKPSALTPDGYEQIKRHPALGARILRQAPFLAAHLPIAELHRERPDGRGYPFGLRGEDIPLAARIAHVADAYDAMTTARAYRRACGRGEAVSELQRNVGAQFDEVSVEALLSALPFSTDMPEPALQEMLGRQLA